MRQGTCIGGPLDGKVYHAPGETFNAAVLPKRPVLPYHLDTLPEPRVVQYRYEWIRTRRAVFGMWIIEGMSIEEAYQAIFSAYRKQHDPNLFHQGNPAVGQQGR